MRISRPTLRRGAAALAAAATVLALSACGSSSTSSPTATTPSAGASTTTAAADLPTVEKGKLTIATGEPAYSPWVENDDPESGEGFEAAVAYAVAEQLGFSKDQVVWKRSTFDSAIAPGPKDWDFNLQQFSITDERKQAVDFSSPYYVTAQAVLTIKGSAAESATTIADLKKIKFGVQAGSTSATALEKFVDPDSDPLQFNSSQDTVQALKGGQVEAIVVDLPQALYLAGVELSDLGGKVIGQFEDTTGGDEYGLVLPKGSELTTPVTAAVDALREDGTLAELQEKWLSSNISVPVLK
ncbi:ABC transporter substrate-binding protein [Rarobacter incanus]|uniref:Amino acid ABC transporter substrate-binding protein (PAAT family) n=1 Tax=Rarobacter incanus TaxID=153494 RepID=A0A542SQ03_9MICO|nr:ABC transporter substrate-binding protein [Rarobacter incanus]TQK76655.1 amino acid ABC transporter substrate-binding protein (PAAT family) [Rarobacter incanus]